MEAGWVWHVPQKKFLESNQRASKMTNYPDVVVIGGGPAGATASTIIAQQGFKVLLFERETFPRFHIGESLIPETYWVLKRLNMIPKLQQSRFIKKHSVQFVSASGKASAPFYFWDNKPHECSQTWQVVRSEFDQMMLENARQHGVDVREGTRVLDVLFEGDRAVGVKIKTSDDIVQKIACRVVVDASGQSGLIQNKLKLRVWDPLLNKGAIWTYYEGAYRDSDKDEGATVVIQTPNKHGWFWNIPLHDDRLSLGVVGPFDYLFGGRGSHEEVFLEEVKNCPAVLERIKAAKRITGYFATKDYSYRGTKWAGDGWVTIGDAFGFLDPLYSSGIMLALKSGELAGDAIGEGLRMGDTSEAQIGQWGGLFNQGIDRMRRLVCEYYDGFNFGNFVKQFPELRGKVTDLLIGDLFNDAVDVVWAPLESLYEANKSVPIGWNAANGQPSEKTNELSIPEGQKP